MPQRIGGEQLRRGRGSRRAGRGCPRDRTVSAGPYPDDRPRRALRRRALRAPARECEPAAARAVRRRAPGSDRDHGRAAQDRARPLPGRCADRPGVALGGAATSARRRPRGRRPDHPVGRDARSDPGGGARGQRTDLRARARRDGRRQGGGGGGDPPELSEGRPAVRSSQLRRAQREPARERAVRAREGRIHRRRRRQTRAPRDGRRRDDLPRRSRGASPVDAGEAAAGARTARGAARGRAGSATGRRTLRRRHQP